jgi:hypothetical protein
MQLDGEENSHRHSQTNKDDIAKRMALPVGVYRDPSKQRSKLRSNDVA